MNSKYIAGYLLLEILVTVGILAVGLLGVAGMQVNSLKGGVSAVQRGEAAILVSAMTDRMRANTNGVYAFNYTNTGDINTNTSNYNNAATNPATRASIDFSIWLREINAVFPASSAPQARIDCSARPNCIIELSWLDPRVKSDLNTTANPRYRHIASVVF